MKYSDLFFYFKFKIKLFIFIIFKYILLFNQNLFKKLFDKTIIDEKNIINIYIFINQIYITKISKKYFILNNKIKS